MDHRLGMTMDAAEPRELGSFWAFALGYVEEPAPEGFDTWYAALEAWGFPREQWDDFYAVVDPDGAGPRLFFQRVPERKTAKNRLHLDVGVPGDQPEDPAEKTAALRAHAALLVERGAVVVQEKNEPTLGFWIVMADPEGNEFCVV